MEIELDPLSTVPLYQQLRDRIVEAIAAGQLVPGDQLGSVRQLAIAYGINVATVSKGYELLREEGLISTSTKSRSVVARGPASAPAPTAGSTDGWHARLTTILAEAVAQGIRADDISRQTRAILDAFADGRSGPPRTTDGKDHETETTI